MAPPSEDDDDGEDDDDDHDTEDSESDSDSDEETLMDERAAHREMQRRLTAAALPPQLAPISESTMSDEEPTPRHHP